MELAKRYDPKEIEPRWYEAWESKGLFTPDAKSRAKPFTIVIPPPNVTGVLHMGHALDNTFQDLIVRWRRMKGARTLWLPGTDHAGIATQAVVEKELKKKEKKSRHDIGREAFVERVWKWKEEQGGTIVRQLRRLGASCDWSRERFTMDAGLSRAVEEVFVRLHERGRVYRGKYLINWCPRCQTALSNEESIPTEKKGHLWHLRYPLEGGQGHVTVATTRPETMLGDTAVAVNPNDERYRALVGKTAVLPFLGRKLPIIADDHVRFGGKCPKCEKRFGAGVETCPEDGTPLALEIGTGVLKITPAHDPHDFEIGNRHSLPRVDVFTPDAKINENGGEFAGLDRFEARKKIVAELEAKGLLDKVEDHVNEVPQCQRCETVVEPRLSTQWFVRMKPLAEPAIRGHRAGETVFHPERWGNVYARWLEEIRDWCISRQLWWGHRIPAWYCATCDAPHRVVEGDGTVRFTDAATPIVSRGRPTHCSRCGGQDLVQDPDVLDTWFSSWLWPFSTMGWPGDTADFRTFYPTDVLVTGPDIIFFWVARMIMAGYEFTGKAPFRDVFLHGLLCDEKGEKMSKSRGNGIDPLVMVDKFSADALRFALVILTAEGQDTRFSEGKVEEGRNYCTKLWNAARLLFPHLEGLAACDPPKSDRLEDRWILSRLGAAIRSIDDSFQAFRFNEAIRTAKEFFWNDFCDDYLEWIKSRLYGDEGEESKRTAAAIGARVFDAILRLTHPFMPFVTEELWQRLGDLVGGRSGDPEHLLRAAYPDPALAPLADPEADAIAGLLSEVIREIRNVRSKYDVAPKQELAVHLTSTGAAAPGLRGDALAVLRPLAPLIRRIAGVGRLAIEEGTLRPKQSSSAILGPVKVFVELGEVADLSKEKTRIEKEIASRENSLANVRKKLENKAFVDNAPAEVVEQQRASGRRFEVELEELRRDLQELS